MIRTLQLIVLHEADDEMLQATITTSKMRCLSLLSGVISDVYCNYSTSCVGLTHYFLFLKINLFPFYVSCKFQAFDGE